MPASDELRALRRLVAALMGSPGRALPMALGAPPARVRQHGLAPLCFRAGCASFRDDHAMGAAMALHRHEQLASLLDRLGERGIEPVLLKGTSYARSLYDDAALRPMDDIDLLVRPDQLADAIRAAKQDGYRVRAVDGAPVSAPIHHAIAMDHERWPCPLDVHRSITGPFRNRMRVMPLWQRATPVAGLRARRLDPVDEAVVHLVHLARSSFAVRAIGFVDAARLLGRLNDTQCRVLRTRVRHDRLGRAVGAALAVVRMIERDESRVRPQAPRGLPSADEILSGDAVPIRRHHLRQVWMSDSPAYAWGYVREHLRVIDTPRKLLDWRRRARARSAPEAPRRPPPGPRPPRPARP